MMKKISQNGLDFIKKWEGLRLMAYTDIGGVWTIGYGHTKNAKEGMLITHEQAEQYLLHDIRDAEQIVNKYVKIQINQSQFDSLCSLVYNVGYVNFIDSRLYKYLCIYDFINMSVEWGDKEFGFVNAGGKFVEGLFLRRQAELKLFFSNNNNNNIKKMSKITDFFGKLKGYRTLITNGAIVVAGALWVYTTAGKKIVEVVGEDVITQGVIAVADNADEAVVILNTFSSNPGLALMIFGLWNIFLRFKTTTPVGKKELPQE